MPPAQIIRVNAESPEPAALRQAADCLRRGGIVIFPTRGLYGLAADPENPEAVKSLFALKGRSEKNPVLLLVESIAQVEEIAAEVPPQARAIMESLWPGGVTIVLSASSQVDPLLCAGSGKIGLRMAGHPVARALVREFGRAITGTSANPSGLPAASDPDLLDPAILAGADLLLDGGKLAGGPGSTVVDVTVTPFLILRHGAVKEETLIKAVKMPFGRIGRIPPRER